MEKVLIDTDVIIDFLRGYKHRLKNFFPRVQKGKIRAIISSISLVELFEGVGGNNKKQKILLNKLLFFLEVVSLDSLLARSAGQLKKEYKLDLADSIIAATAIDKESHLLTFNQKHFKKIKEIQLYHLTT